MQKTRTQTKRAASAAKLVTSSSRSAVEPEVEPTPEHHKEIRAERFSLVDEAGNERAHLGTCGGGCFLVMKDGKGRARLRIRADLNEATISIAGERGEAGKGVLPTEDEVERVIIGYEGRAQKPHIVIKDGNERECVSLSIDSDDGDGKALFEMPNGAYTGVNSSGMGVYTHAGAALTEFSAPEDANERPEASAPRDKDKPAAELANAFAIIEKYQDYLPKDLYKAVDDYLLDVFTNGQSDPDTLRRILLPALRLKIEEQSEKEAA
ncbi:MAG: hypothetical protein ACREAM_28590 [Blastocatellia bacterium]